VTFSNIPQNYTDLKVVLSTRGSSNSYFTQGIRITFNDITSGYTTKIVGSDSVDAVSGSNPYSVTSASIGMFGNNGQSTASTFGNAEIYIPNYAGSNHKSFSMDSVTETNGSSRYNTQMYFSAGLLSNAAAITSIKFEPQTDEGTFVANSTFTLYGVSNGVKAVGGTLTVAGGYAYHTFTSTGSFLPSQKITGAEILSIAGGGGGGGNKGGGGGAGGLRYLNSQTLNAGNSYTAVVGSGGAGSASTTGPGSNGSNSAIMSFTSTGGGGGGGGDAGGGTNINGLDGGSGGGSANNGAGTPVVGIGVVGQGNNGGAVDIASSLNPGGGGGATEAGFSGVAGSTQGFGGSGSYSYSVWGSVTGTGQLVGGVYYYAGGGAGGSSVAEWNAKGGNGGGGTGGQRSVNDDTAGTANTGGGGGGGSTGAAAYAGSAGGSGIIIIRYPLT
jgi:hypothetical protein